MEWHRALRRFALRQTYLAKRPSATHVDHLVSEIDVLPLQAQAFGYTETCAGGQKRESAFRLSEVTDDCIRLLGVRIIASYPLVVLQRTKRMGFDSWLQGIRPYLGHAYTTKDMTRRVLSSVGLARPPSF